MCFWIWRCVYNFTPHLGSILQLDSLTLPWTFFWKCKKMQTDLIVQMEAAKPWLPRVRLAILHHSASFCYLLLSVGYCFDSLKPLTTLPLKSTSTSYSLPILSFTRSTSRTLNSSAGWMTSVCTKQSSQRYAWHFGNQQLM